MARRVFATTRPSQCDPSRATTAAPGAATRPCDPAPAPSGSGAVAGTPGSGAPAAGAGEAHEHVASGGRISSAAASVARLTSEQAVALEHALMRTARIQSTRVFRLVAMCLGAVALTGYFFGDEIVNYLSQRGSDVASKTLQHEDVQLQVSACHCRAGHRPPPRCVALTAPSPATPRQSRWPRR